MSEESYCKNLVKPASEGNVKATDIEASENATCGKPSNAVNGNKTSRRSIPQSTSHLLYRDPKKKVQPGVIKSKSSSTIVQRSARKLATFSTSKKDLSSVGKRKRIVTNSSPIVQSPKRNISRAKCCIDFNIKPDIKFSSCTVFPRSTTGTAAPASEKKVNFKSRNTRSSQIEIELKQKCEELEQKLSVFDDYDVKLLNLEDELRTSQGQVKDLIGEKKTLEEKLVQKDSDYQKQLSSQHTQLERCQQKLIEIKVDPVSMENLQISDEAEKKIGHNKHLQMEKAKLLLEKLQYFSVKAEGFLETMNLENESLHSVNCSRDFNTSRNFNTSCIQEYNSTN